MSLGGKTYYENNLFKHSMRETLLHTPSFEALMMGGLLL
jgi:hypothetical protein